MVFFKRWAFFTAISFLLFVCIVRPLNGYFYGPPLISLKFFDTVEKSTILGIKKLTGVSSKSSLATDTSLDDIEPLEFLLSLSFPSNLNSTYRPCLVR